MTTPVMSDPPEKLDNDYVRTTLKSIKKSQSDQILLEAERAGAAKLRAKFAALFGSIFTAAVVGGFLWVLDAQSQLQTHDSEIAHIKERQLEHGHRDLENQANETNHRVDAVERGQKLRDAQFARRDQEQHERLEQILQAVRQNRRGRRWGD